MFKFIREWLATRTIIENKSEISLEGLSREDKNTLGKSRGYGNCSCCHDSWMYKESHTTYYTEYKGTFPLCEECWSRMTIEQRLHHYHVIVDNWVHSRNLSEREEYRELLIKAVMEGK